MFCRSLALVLLESNTQNRIKHRSPTGSWTFACRFHLRTPAWSEAHPGVLKQPIMTVLGRALNFGHHPPRNRAAFLSRGHPACYGSERLAQQDCQRYGSNFQRQSRQHCIRV
eukprot:3079690-Amphidinium_carterae.2